MKERHKEKKKKKKNKNKDIWKKKTLFDSTPKKRQIQIVQTI